MEKPAKTVAYLRVSTTEQDLQKNKFDILHLARTSARADDDRLPELEHRAHSYAEALCDFYGGPLGPGYRLHKLPGGLAALHECALIKRFSALPELRVAPVDVARHACWI